MTFDQLSSATGVPARILEAISRVESGGSVRAVRFERRLFTERGGSVSGLPSGTGHATVRAAIARFPRAAVESTSWGRFQVLGGRGLVLYGDPVSFVRAFEAGPADVGDRMLVRWFQENPRARAAASSGDLGELGRRYNGSRDPDGAAGPLTSRWVARLTAELRTIDSGAMGAAKLEIGQALATGLVATAAGVSLPLAVGAAAVVASRRRRS